jgi:hypothetical protein
VSVITQVVYVSKTFKKVLAEIRHWLSPISLGQHLLLRRQKLDQFLYQRPNPQVSG